MFVKKREMYIPRWAKTILIDLVHTSLVIHIYMVWYILIDSNRVRSAIRTRDGIQSAECAYLN